MDNLKRTASEHGPRSEAITPRVRQRRGVVLRRLQRPGSHQEPRSHARLGDYEAARNRATAPVRRSKALDSWRDVAASPDKLGLKGPHTVTKVKHCKGQISAPAAHSFIGARARSSPDSTNLPRSHRLRRFHCLLQPPARTLGAVT